MLCYQCEQTLRTSQRLGCSFAQGMCGKNAQTSDLQDVLNYQIKGIAQYAQVVRAMGMADDEASDFIKYGLFTTLTNVNFSAERFLPLIAKATQIRNRLRDAYLTKSKDTGIDVFPLTGPAAWDPPVDLMTRKQGLAEVAVNADQDEVGADVIGLRVLILYGMKGVAAYAHHARVLGYHDEAADAEIERILSYLANQPTDIDELLAQSLAVGDLNLQIMALLDKANTETFGKPEISQVCISPVPGHAILVSGHDLHDLAQILEQTKDTGVHVYTHGELLPAHSYPGLKKYSHLVGNYGSAWQNQQIEFATFPGPIVMTSNCLIEPTPEYRDRVYTCGPVGWSGIPHIDQGDFSAVIAQAKTCKGFTEDAPEQKITTGFGHDTVMSVADKVIDAVKGGQIRHFFVIGGCDGAEPGRNYYTDLADQTPNDTVILTLGCSKYRFNQHEYGDIGGIPRLLDVGQCNDAYSAIKIASALAGAFNCSVNELPLSLMISWFEQKATAVLLSLLAVGVKGIHLGPRLPVYLTPNLIAVLQDKFDIRVNGTPEEDLKLALVSA